MLTIGAISAHICMFDQRVKVHMRSGYHKPASEPLQLPPPRARRTTRTRAMIEAANVVAADQDDRHVGPYSSAAPTWRLRWARAALAGPIGFEIAADSKP